MFRNFVKLAAFGVFLTACTAATPIPATLSTAIPNQLSKQTPGADTVPGYQVVLVQSVITVGPNRFAIGILDGDSFVKNAKLTMVFYFLGGNANDSPKAVSTVPAVYREAPGGFAAMYTAEMNFPTAGSWGLAIAGTTADGKVIDQKVGFDVVATSADLPVGKKAPAAKSPTLVDVNGDLKKLTSAPQPNPAFYKLSLDQAIASGKPTLVQFSTPAFCTSRLCGPAYNVMNEAYEIYADRLLFVHVEVYKDLPNPDLAKPHLADAMVAWGLTTEPWTYLLDKNGIVVWRAEGLITTGELKEAIDNLLKIS